MNGVINCFSGSMRQKNLFPEFSNISEFEKGPQAVVSPVGLSLNTMIVIQRGVWFGERIE